MKKSLAVFFAVTGWFAVITQYVLMIENRVVPVAESTTRFFSFFTILTNILVAVYFTCLIFKMKFSEKPGTLTAITSYITMVGLVYQVALRQVWQPKGLQLVVDELLHSVIPVFVILFWYLFENIRNIKYWQISTWSVYPLFYLLFILIQGNFSGFYPYPFIDVTNLGLTKALLNAAILLILFLVISSLFIFIGKLFSQGNKLAANI